MLISARSGIVNAKGYEQITVGEYTVYISGVLFIRGLKAGVESVKWMIESYANLGAVPFDKLCGAYSIVIDNCAGELICFSDNSAMRGLIVGEYCIGSNFLELAKYEKHTKLNEKSVCEYLTLTRGLFLNSFIEGLSCVDYLSYYVLKDGQITKRSKGIGDISATSGIKNPVEFINDVAYALSDLKCICALTGGYDSRMVAACLNQVYPVDCFISGERDDSAEIKCAVRAAKEGGLDMRVIKPQFPEISDNLIRSTFYGSGAYRQRISTAGYRIIYFRRQLKQEGYQVLLTGDAGDMHKDFWLVQDVFSYWSRKTHVERFYKRRLEIINYSEYLADSFKSEYAKLQKEQIEFLKGLKKERNSQSYLTFGWYGDWGPQSIDRAEYDNPVPYNPLQEIDLVRYSYQILPKGKRFNYFLRQMTTNANPKMARAVTEYKTTASSEKVYMFRDAFVQIYATGIRALRFVFRRLTGKTYFTDTINETDLESKIRETTLAKESLFWAKEKGYIRSDVELLAIPYFLLERIMNLFLVKTELDNSLERDCMES